VTDLLPVDFCLNHPLHPAPCAEKSIVRFAPKSDRKSGFPQNVMSAFTPKAVIGTAQSKVC
jgi:hypothetical protein